MNKLKYNFKTALRNCKADLVLKNAFIINVFDGSIDYGNIAINGDTIVGIGDYEGNEEIDCKNCYIAPGFIDTHVHIESSKVTPQIFSRILIKKGVTTCIADPHEIANVLGEDGISFMIKDSKKSVIDIFFMMPSCVPAVEFEDNGAVLNSKKLKKFVNNEKVLGLGEVMDVPAVVYGKDDMLKKIELFKDKHIDGHCPNIDEYWLNAYLNAGITTDHECTTPEEAIRKVKKGMYVMLRQGSAAKNLEDLLPAVNNNNFHKFLFCTDDKDIVDLVETGSIDECIRLAIKGGIDPVKAIIIATLNGAQCYGIKNRGAVAPGYKADLVILEDLKEVKVKDVIKNGKIYKEEMAEDFDGNLGNSMNISYIDKKVFKIKAKSNKINVIKVIKNSIETKKCIREVTIKDEYVDSVISKDALKIGVFERHKHTGRYSIGFIEGLGLRNCSIAQTIAHDSHNIIVVGDNDEDMQVAVNRVISIGGGIVAVSNGEILDELSLPFGGLMTSKKVDFVINKIKSLNRICKSYGNDEELNVFLTIGFMALPVIPEVRITTKGLYDFNKREFIDLFL
ncbi:adenine deaminase [Clostridium thermopalmarium]|uniref:Adenine deaminase n=1 Tax=Clostridium thermopalmarium DSM 5974 TaxID=1121340 RepID=A0A2T0ASF5_9CLOT|nr:adenine deaminase [Clostridium thermopalmarium]MBE6044891.1 adenine deaminase [Clostridium thermopalmarium]PRR73176.1 Adenine deaminase [Clostridium thermopalmarium DSM 5974]PVZ25259.1 adenine deaminase [Clostridium thermopalmarium DSM 5974]